jgi:D-beta-D-heptose 7-phosphate kinase / D-beta-D-heptose 1-phosphate adenosyltransferase
MTYIETLDLIEHMKPCVAVVGDPIRDDYVFGRVERICPEAPVPIFIPERKESRPGGAANVAHQLSVLGCKVVACFPQKVSVKTRYIADSHLCLRIDEDAEYRPTRNDVLAVREALVAANPQAVVLSDYDKGWLSEDMCQEITLSGKYSHVIVDPKGYDFNKYRGCQLICPNEEEAHDLAIRAHTFPAVLYKRGPLGLRLVMGSWGIDISAEARRVYDVTGAGDTVVAVTAAGIAAGADYEDAAKLANLAAGYVVGEVGTTVCSLDTLKELAYVRAKNP